MECFNYGNYPIPRVSFGLIGPSRDRSRSLRCLSVRASPFVPLIGKSIAGEITIGSSETLHRKTAVTRQKGERRIMSSSSTNQSKTASPWVRIPDGTRVKHRHEGHEGVIDGLTEFVRGPNRHPDGKTQYRMNIGTPTRQLVTESDLCILLGSDDLVIMVRQKEPYRRNVTEQLRGWFAADRFMKFAKPQRD